MGASLPCSAANDCCGKKNEEMFAFPERNTGDRIPGLRLDMPMAVEQSKAPKDAGFEDGPEAPGKPDPEAPDRPAPDDQAVGGSASPRSLPPADDNESQASMPRASPAARPLGTADGAAQEPPAEEFLVPAPEATPGAAGSAAPPGGKLVLEFERPDGSVETVDFSGRAPPMGLDFAKSSPVTVHRVKRGGHAAELGIQPAWLLKSVNGRCVEDVPFGEAMEMLHLAARSGADGPAVGAGLPTGVLSMSASGPQAPMCSAPMPTPGVSSRTKEFPDQGGLVMVFQLPDGSSRTADFRGRNPPLGMDFDRDTALTVKNVKPHGHGEELGVEPGWLVTHINSTPVEGKSPMEVFILMKAAVRPSAQAR